jgi:sensor c-di-GMP phosphodiesterase-like protein
VTETSEGDGMSDLDTVRKGLERGEFFLEYLPIVSLKTGRCHGGEALIRWRRDATVVPPLEFIPIVENTPLSGAITYWVVDTVASELGEWLRAHPEARISVNVPPELLGRGGVLYAAEKSGLIATPGQIVVEVTERGIPDKIGVDALRAAVGHGVQVALDDVGAHGVNLVILSRAHIHIVKLCKEFLDNLDDETRRVSSNKLIALWRGTGIQMIAEGVETTRQAEILAEAGVQMAQGWLYSRPLGVDAFKAYFNAHQQ